MIGVGLHPYNGRMHLDGRNTLPQSCVTVFTRPSLSLCLISLLCWQCSYKDQNEVWKWHSADIGSFDPSLSCSIRETQGQVCLANCCRSLMTCWAAMDFICLSLAEVIEDQNGCHQWVTVSQQGSHYSQPGVIWSMIYEYLTFNQSFHPCLSTS